MDLAGVGGPGRGAATGLATAHGAAAVGGCAYTVELGALGLGPLLAEGGEGRVFDVTAVPEGAAVHGRVVYKQLRTPRPTDELRAVAAYPSALAAVSAELASRAGRSAAWPVLAVVGAPGDDRAVGLLMPAAPARFSLVHRDGIPRLAGLSYLATDPDRVALAYGVDLPAPGAAERVALVRCLAMLLEAWQEAPGAGPVAHGDLSARNVLWSLSPTPCVFVIDCDGAVLPALPARARATTPNWDDPAVGPGGPVGTAADRYALGLAFLRVVGAANYPLQSRQRAADSVVVDLELPRSWRRLPDMPALWQLCERSLSLVAAQDRPCPSEWVAALGELLVLLGAGHLVEVGVGAKAALAATVPDVAVRPVLVNRVASTWQLVNPGRQGSNVGGDGAGPGAGNAVLFGLPAGASARQLLRAAGSSWLGAHRLGGRLLGRPGRRRHGARRLTGLVLFDLAAACIVLFLVGMVVSPWIGL